MRHTCKQSTQFVELGRIIEEIHFKSVIGEGELHSRPLIWQTPTCFYYALYCKSMSSHVPHEKRLPNSQAANKIIFTM